MADEEASGVAELRSNEEREPIVSVPLAKDDAQALLASWRCCGAPNICGARCMDDEETHRLAQFAAFIDNEEANNSGVLAEVTRLRTENKRQVAIRQHAQEAHAAACGALATTLTDLSAARVEVSQLRAKIEAVAHAIEEEAQPEPEWHADSQRESIRGSALRWAARVVRVALAEPLGSTPEQEQAK